MTSQPQQDPARSIALSRLAGAALGTRFSVRYALPTGDPSGKGRTDAIGTLVCRHDDPPAVTLQTRSGPVRIPLELVRLAREVPPPVPRRRPR